HERCDPVDRSTRGHPRPRASRGCPPRCGPPSEEDGLLFAGDVGRARLCVLFHCRRVRGGASVNIDVRRATENDLPGILSLLAESGLPQDGLSDHLETTLVAIDNGRIVGSAALELY